MLGALQLAPAGPAPPPPPPPLFVLRGHRSDVTSVEFCDLPSSWLPTHSASARLRDATVPCVVSGDGNGQVTLWDLRTRRPLLSFLAHK